MTGTDILALLRAHYDLPAIFEQIGASDVGHILTCCGGF